jgi:hypothetical protein
MDALHEAVRQSIGRLAERAPVPPSDISWQRDNSRGKQQQKQQQHQQQESQQVQ